MIWKDDSGTNRVVKQLVDIKRQQTTYAFSDAWSYIVELQMSKL
jgi:hypothetical protein